MNYFCFAYCYIKLNIYICKVKQLKNNKMKATVKTQKLSNEAQNLFVELVSISLNKYSKTTLNMVGNTILFYSQLTPFSNVSLSYLTSLCQNKGIKAKIN